MEKLQLDYSYKNIPIPPERSYKLQLMDKIELVIKRMRWKAYFYDKGNKNNNNDNENIPETYGLKTQQCPPQVKELTAFENELLELIKIIKFRKRQSNFQEKLNEDIKTINNTNKTLTFADKTSNLYKLSKEEYNKLLNESITTTYKMVSDKISDKINSEGKALVKNKIVLNRMLTNGKDNCFITLKDHKPNFQNNPKTRLINPAKNEIGRISKVILDKINHTLRNKTKINQRNETNEVVAWFSKISEKNKHKFIIFDIKDFYPTINKKLLTNALRFAEETIYVGEEDKRNIYHARKSLLYNDNQTWMKKGGEQFDVTMGAYDGAEVCELVDIYMLNKISKHYNINNMGLYRDDGLAVFKNISGPESERVKKKLQSIFKEEGLDIIIECNKKIVNYLDITLDLNDGTYKPYHKPDNVIQYINVESNHPQNIIKQIPITIEKRLSEHSSNESIFKEAVPIYEEALNKSGYNTKLKYNPPQNNNNNNKNRKRNIIWFNPPYNKNVSTKIGNFFLNLIDKDFPTNHKFHKLFNRNSVKVSYSCTKNIKKIINSHNQKVLSQKDVNSVDKECNCVHKEKCPLNGKCLIQNIVYGATITSNEPNYKEKLYLGISEAPFKKRFANHKKSFNAAKYENETELSKEYWKIKKTNFIPQLKWKIVRKCSPFNRASMKCNLCLSEKLEIALFKEDNLLNKRTELISKCGHLNKYTLLRHDSKD